MDSAGFSNKKMPRGCCEQYMISKADPKKKKVNSGLPTQEVARGKWLEVNSNVVIFIDDFFYLARENNTPNNNGSKTEGTPKPTN